MNEQIEEMARIASKCMTSWLNNETSKTLPEHIAEAIYNADYRKVPKTLESFPTGITPSTNCITTEPCCSL